MMKRTQRTHQRKAVQDVLGHQAKHPWLTVALFGFMFPPAILLIVVVGKVFQRLFPEPAVWLIFLAVPFFILVLPVGMLIGALLFALVMKHFVEKAVLAPFYLYPGVPITSVLSALVFRWAYGLDKESAKKVGRR